MSVSTEKLILLASNLEELATQLLEKSAGKKPEHEMTHDEWAKKNPKMSDWSNKDWSKYLDKSKPKDTNKADDEHETFMQWLEEEYGHNERKHYPKASPEAKKHLREMYEYSKNTKKAAKKDKPKLDPKAKVRNKGDVIFPAESSNVSDHKDHFPINSENQARNALSQVAKYDKVPPWYKGSLKSLQDAVSRKVHSKYKKIGKDKKKSSSLEVLMTKYS